MTSIGFMETDDEYLDKARESLMNKWDCSSFSVWHRQFKKYGGINSSYVNGLVIIAKFKGSIYSDPTKKVGYIPFIYQQVRIIVWN
jgi:hypothetical protein